MVFILRLFYFFMTLALKIDKMLNYSAEQQISVVLKAQILVRICSNDLCFKILKAK